jgi:hypothetical protein
LDFADAWQIFDTPMLTALDTREDYGEERFEVTTAGWLSWLHEREWRCKGLFKLPSRIQAVLVKNTKDAKKLAEHISDDPSFFRCLPSSIIPLTVLSQGLLAPS